MTVPVYTGLYPPALRLIFCLPSVRATTVSRPCHCGLLFLETLWLHRVVLNADWWILSDRATTDRGGSNARGGSQVGGRQGGMNDAPLTNKVRVAPSRLSPISHVQGKETRTRSTKQ